MRRIILGSACEVNAGHDERNPTDTEMKHEPSAAHARQRSSPTLHSLTTTAPACAFCTPIPLTRFAKAPSAAESFPQIGLRFLHFLPE